MSVTLLGIVGSAKQIVGKAPACRELTVYREPGINQEGYLQHTTDRGLRTRLNKEKTEQTIKIK